MSKSSIVFIVVCCLFIAALSVACSPQRSIETTVETANSPETDEAPVEDASTADFKRINSVSIPGHGRLSVLYDEKTGCFYHLFNSDSMEVICQ